jgi:hypothetical protein
MPSDSTAAKGDELRAKAKQALKLIIGQAADVVGHGVAGRPDAAWACVLGRTVGT